VAAFFTSFLGFPCTLARYPDHRRVLSQQMEHESLGDHQGSTVKLQQSSLFATEQLPPRASHIIDDLPVRNSITISRNTSSANTSNITTSSSLAPYWKSFGIGPHYFQSLPPVTSPTSQSQYNIRHMPNLFDQSVSAQYPTVQVGDAIQTFSPTTAAKRRGCAPPSRRCSPPSTSVLYRRVGSRWTRKRRRASSCSFTRRARKARLWYQRRAALK
jgi:hypothetical protein